MTTANLSGSISATKTTPSTPHLYLTKYYEKTWEQRKASTARSGIKRAEHRIGYETERMALSVASAPIKGEYWENDRLDNIQLCMDQISICTREIAEHQEVLASLPAQA
jgi:hypothetical protein